MILETKLTLPQPKAGMLLRKSLIELIKNNLDKKLILITAGAGCGKTTLLNQLLRQARQPYVYYSIDEADGNVMTFYSHLIRGLEALNLGALRQCRQLLSGAEGTEVNFDLMMGTLINELLGNASGEMLLCFDDYHNIGEESNVHKAVEYFIGRMPASVHVIISSRNKLPFRSSSVWLAKGETYELTAENLAFSENEIQELLINSNRLDWNDQDVKLLHTHTDGWITGVVMIVQNAAAGRKEVPAGNMFSGIGNHQGLLRYLTDEIFFHEDAKTREFLLASSILDVVSAGECDAMFGLKGSADILERLERRNIFITRIDQRQYRYHKLFQEYLQWRLGDKTELQKIHFRAADYYRKTREPEKAIGHYLKAGHYQKACRAMNLVLEAMTSAARYRTLLSWLEEIPAGYLEKELRLKLEKAIIYRVYGRLEEAEELLVAVERKIFNRLKQKQGDRAKSAVLAETLIERARICWIRKQPRQAVVLLQRARRCCPEKSYNHLASIYNSLGVAYAEMNNLSQHRKYSSMALRIYSRNKRWETLCISVDFNLIAVLSRQGEVKQALDRFKSLYQKMKGKYSIGAGHRLVYGLEMALIAGETDWAKRFLLEAENLCQPYQDPKSAAAICFGHGNLWANQGQWEKSIGYLKTAGNEYAKLGIASGECGALRKMAAIYRSLGRYDEAGQCLNQAKRLVTGRDSFDWIYYEIECLWLKTATGDYDGLDERLRSVTRMAGRLGYLLALFKARLCTAALCLLRRKEENAANHLRWAARLSSQKGFRALFLQELNGNPDLQRLATKLGLYETGSGKRRSPSNAEVIPSQQIDITAKLFGAIRIGLSTGQELPIAWRSRKAESLLAYLIMHRNRVCFREELMEALWPRADVRRAEQSLHAWIYQIKKNVAARFDSCCAPSTGKAPIIIHQEKGYRINPAFNLAVDADEFVATWDKAGQSLKSNGGAAGIGLLERCRALYADRFW